MTILIQNKIKNYASVSPCLYSNMYTAVCTICTWYIYTVSPRVRGVTVLVLVLVLASGRHVARSRPSSGSGST